MEKIGLLLTILGLAQSQYTHNEDQNTTRRIFMREIVHESYTANLEMETECFSDIFQAERDTYEQRNQQIQTILLSSSITFAGTLTVVIQAILPKESSTITFYLMAFFGGSSFAFIIGAITICVELLNRTSEFMVERAKQHASISNETRNDLNALIQQLENGLNELDLEQQQTYAVNNNFVSFFQQKMGFQQTNNLKTKEEFAINNLKRQQLLVKQKLQANNRNSFDLFWGSKCAYPKMWAVLMFYASTICTIISCGIFINAQYSIVYNCSAAGVFFIVSCICMSVFMFVVIIKNRLKKHNVTSSTTTDDNIPDLEDNDNSSIITNFSNN
jgi:uncharacterized membrane protein